MNAQQTSVSQALRLFGGYRAARIDGELAYGLEPFLGMVESFADSRMEELLSEFRRARFRLPAPADAPASARYAPDALAAVLGEMTELTPTDVVVGAGIVRMLRTELPRLAVFLARRGEFPERSYRQFFAGWVRRHRRTYAQWHAIQSEVERRALRVGGEDGPGKLLVGWFLVEKAVGSALTLVAANLETMSTRRLEAVVAPKTLVKLCRPGMGLNAAVAVGGTIPLLVASALPTDQPKDAPEDDGKDEVGI